MYSSRKLIPGLFIALLTLGPSFHSMAQKGSNDTRFGGELDVEWGSGSSGKISSAYGANFTVFLPRKNVDFWGNLGLNIHPEYRYTRHSLEINNRSENATGYKKATTLDLLGGYKIGGVSDRKDFSLYFSNALDLRFGWMTIRNDGTKAELEFLGISKERTETVGDLYFLGEAGVAFKVGPGAVNIGLRSSIGIVGFFSRFGSGLKEEDSGQKEEIKLEEDFFLPFNYTGPRLRYTF
ncbi:MAG: hypothetical protein ABEH38_00320 [Flavobacteriales bacterium]